MKATLPFVIAMAGLIPVEVSASPALKEKPTVDVVVARHLEAMGGLERMRALKSVSYSAVEAWDGKQAQITATRARPNLMRFEHTDGAATMIKAFDGTAGWSSKDGAVEAIAADKMRGKTDFDDALIDSAARGHKVELVGEEQMDGSPVYLLKVTRAGGGAEETRAIDARTFLETRRTVSFVMEGKPMTKTIRFHDYRKVDGIMTSFSQDIEKDGKRGTLTITRLSYDAPVTAAMFAMPPKPASAVSTK